jgi:hypothetical protein
LPAVALPDEPSSACELGPVEGAVESGTVTVTVWAAS